MPVKKFKLCVDNSYVTLFFLSLSQTKPLAHKLPVVFVVLLLELIAQLKTMVSNV